MIAFRDDLPVLVMGDRTAMAFDRGWFTRALNVAARRAGHPQWWLATHIADSVHAWLKTLTERTELPVAVFTRAVREALKVIGFAEIGDCFQACTPFARISLTEMARDAGNGFELAFFNTLHRRLDDVVRCGGSYCELHGLEHSVRVLKRQRTWTRECEALRGEIVAFTRDHTVRLCDTKGRSGRELFVHVA